MYQKILTFSLIFLAAVATVSFSPALFFGHVQPDIVLILVIIWSSRKSFEDFWIWAIVAGFVLDTVTLGRIGVNAISFVIISFGINFLSKRFFIGQRRYAFFWVAALVLAGSIVNYASGTGLGVMVGESSPNAFNFRTLIFKIIDNLTMLAVIYWPVVSSRRIFPIEEQRLVVK